MWSSKGYKVFRVTLIIKENNKFAGAWLVIYHRIVKNFRFRWIFRWRHKHWRISNTILPHEDLGKVHVATSITTIPSESNRVLSVSSEINAASKDRAWKKEYLIKRKSTKNHTFGEVNCYERGNWILLILLQLLLPYLVPNSDSARARATSEWLGRTDRQNTLRV